MAIPPYGAANPRDGIAQALMGINNPPPGYAAGAPPPLGGIPGGAQPQAALGPATPPLGPMGPVGGLTTPGLNLPGVTQPGVLPPGMNPMGAAGGLPQGPPLPQGTNPLQRPSMPGGRAY